VTSAASLEAIMPEAFSENGVRLIEVIAGGDANLRVRRTFSHAH
jgi:hypothetical protein